MVEEERQVLQQTLISSGRRVERKAFYCMVA